MLQESGSIQQRDDIFPLLCVGFILPKQTTTHSHKEEGVDTLIRYGIIDYCSIIIVYTWGN